MKIQRIVSVWSNRILTHNKHSVLPGSLCNLFEAKSVYLARMNEEQGLLNKRFATGRKKSIRRFYPIFLNAIRSVLTPIVFIIFSYLVVRFHSKELWGGFVDYLLFFYLASLVSNWGSKDYLSRKFSEKPNEIIPNWQAHWQARLPLLLITIAIVPFIFEPDTYLFLIIWLIAGYLNNSFIPIYTFKRDFGKVILIELLGFGLLVGLVFNAQHELTVTNLVCFYALHQLVKSIIYGIVYLAFFRFTKIKFNWSLLLLSSPFFLLGCAGFLQSKVDLYVFGFFNEKALLGVYQIISGFFIFSQSIATILLLPYLKNVYRMSTRSIVSLKRQMIGIGFLFNIIVVSAIWLMLSFFFDIHLGLYETIVGFFIGYPSYIYVLHIFYLFRHNKERTVLLISLLSLSFNLILSIVLLSLGIGVLGALIANSVSQLVALFLLLRKKIDDDVFKKIK